MELTCGLVDGDLLQAVQTLRRESYCMNPTRRQGAARHPTGPEHPKPEKEKSKSTSGSAGWASTNMEFDADTSLRAVDRRDQGVRLDRSLVTFHCVRCHTVVGDSLSVCGEFHSMSIMVVRVTDAVSVSDRTESKMEREMTKCLHRSLECSSCHCILGAVVESTPLHLEKLRSVFLLHKESINCYILEQSQMVKASDLVFDHKPIGESIQEAIQQFQAQRDHMTRVHRRLYQQAA